MIDAKLLLDSRKFCMLMDGLANTWKNKKSGDGDRAIALQLVIDSIQPEHIGFPPLQAPAPTLPRAARPTAPAPSIVTGPHAALPASARGKAVKKKRRATPEPSEKDPTDTSLTMSAAEAAEVAREVDRLAAMAPDVPKLMREAVKEYVVDRMSAFGGKHGPVQRDFDGFRHFPIPLTYRGVTMPSSGWEEAMRACGVKVPKELQYDVRLLDQGFLAIMLL